LPSKHKIKSYYGEYADYWYNENSAYWNQTDISYDYDDRYNVYRYTIVNRKSRTKSMYKFNTYLYNSDNPIYYFEQENEDRERARFYKKI